MSTGETGKLVDLDEVRKKNCSENKAKDSSAKAKAGELVNLKTLQECKNLRRLNYPDR